MDFGVAELLRGDAKVIVESLVLSWRNKPVDLQVDQPVKMMHHLKIFFFFKMQRYISKHAGQYWLENDLVKTWWSYQVCVRLVLRMSICLVHV